MLNEERFFLLNNTLMRQKYFTFLLLFVYPQTKLIITLMILNKKRHYFYSCKIFLELYVKYVLVSNCLSLWRIEKLSISFLQQMKNVSSHLIFPSRGLKHHHSKIFFFSFSNFDVSHFLLSEDIFLYLAMNRRILWIISRLLN